MKRVYFIGVLLVVLFDISIGHMLYTKGDPYSNRESILEEASQYISPTKRVKTYSDTQNDCRFGCYVKEDPSDPEVKIAAKVALKEYLQGTKSGSKDLTVDRVIDAKKMVIGFLNNKHHLNFFARAKPDCEMYSFFCSPPQKCKAEVNMRDNRYSVIRIDCKPRLGKSPDQAGWDW